MKTTSAAKYSFLARSEIRHDDAWRPLDRAVANWVRAHGGCMELAALAAWASYADGQGHSALALRTEAEGAIAMPALGAEQRARVATDPLVTVVDPGETARPSTPFVIDGEHFLLRRNFLHEVAVARHVARRRALAQDRSVPAAWVDALFAGADPASVQAQRDAVARVPGRRFFVLTGAPGTGKTTTVLRMLTLLVRDWQAHAGASLPLIRVTAPTGKAAQRLAQSLREGAHRLRDATVRLGGEWNAALDHARSAPASTLHRLLGSTGGQGGFRHHASNRLAADIVIVDEASMMDLSLLRCLLDALRDDALLVLVGDADQLTSIGTGSVLRDIVDALSGAPDLVRLRHSFRADQALVPLNEAVRAGDVARFDAACAGAGERIKRISPSPPQRLQRELTRWGRALHAHLQRIGAFNPIDDETAALAVLDGLRERQLLCALRETEWGADSANEMLDRLLRAELDEVLDGRWYRGRAVMITNNDYSTGLYNGDVGVCLADRAGNFRVWFEGEGAPAGDSGLPARRAMALAIGSLPAHQGAFAVTIHKSQGSEYDHVAVLLADDVDNPILSRELLYTGVSRARSSLELWAREDVIARALARPVQRTGLLGRRLLERS